MPRGVPNAKRDDLGMRFTTFHVPLLPNPKQTGTTYLKSESQTIWARNNKSKLPEDLSVSAPEGRRGSKVIVIQPGSRWLRIGRASDVNPVVVPHVIARKHKPPVPPPTFVEGISRAQKGKLKPQPLPSQTGDVYAVPPPSDDPVDGKIAAITLSLRDRMRFYKLRVTPNGAQLASSFNDQFTPEVIADYNDPHRVEWVTEPPDEETLVCEEVARLSDPQKLGYNVRWPIYGGRFNSRDYSSLQVLLSDVEAIWRTTMKEKLNIESRDFKDYSAVLVIPDLWDRVYVRELVNMLLINLGFKQVCAQQQSLAATYGAGVSNACVIDIGAVKTTVACVDDGLVIADTRMSLSMGGDDITEFLFVLLERISFPYRDIDLARSYDWSLMEDLKIRLCTLAESDVALNLYDFVVRRPGKPTEKYGLRAYDEVILAPMCIFEPRVIEFERKRIGMRSDWHPDVTDEVIEYLTDRLTNAMLISTQHLMPQPHAPPLEPVPVNDAQPPGFTQTEPAFSVAPQPAQGGPPPQISNFEGSKSAKFISIDASTFEGSEGDAIKTDESAAEAGAVGGESKADAAADIIDVDMEDTKPLLVSRPSSPSVPSQAPALESSLQSGQQATGTSTPQQQPPAYIPSTTIGGSNITPFLGNLPIDVCFEASKLPLDVAIFNSARAAGGDEKIRKYLQAVLVVGGTARTPGMAHALESRLQAIATPLVPNMDKVQILPPPKDVDPRVVAWKGAAVLGKMEGVSDLWLTAADWNVLGTRGLKEKCYFL